MKFAAFTSAFLFVAVVSGTTLQKRTCTPSACACTGVGLFCGDSDVNPACATGNVFQCDGANSCDFGVRTTCRLCNLLDCTEGDQMDAKGSSARILVGGEVHTTPPFIGHSARDVRVFTPPIITHTPSFEKPGTVGGVANQTPPIVKPGIMLPPRDAVSPPIIKPETIGSGTIYSPPILKPGTIHPTRDTVSPPVFHPGNIHGSNAPPIVTSGTTGGIVNHTPPIVKPGIMLPPRDAVSSPIMKPGTIGDGAIHNQPGSIGDGAVHTPPFIKPGTVGAGVVA